MTWKYPITVKSNPERNITMISLVLLIAAFILFVLSALNIPSPPRFNLLAAGLACWVLSELFGHGILH